MAKSDPMKSPLKGSPLPLEILEKLARQSISNPDAPFGSKPEQMTLVRHLMWAVRKSQKKDNLRGSVIQISSVKEVLKLTDAETEVVITFLQATIGMSFSRLYY